MVQEHIKQKLGLRDEEEVRLFIDGQRLRSVGDALGVLLGNRGDATESTSTTKCAPHPRWK